MLRFQFTVRDSKFFCDMLTCCDFVPQVSRIAAAFSLQPPIYLVKEFDNTVVFPAEGSGRFSPSSLYSGSEYEVQGNDNNASMPTHAQYFTGSPTPFGAYPLSRCSQPNPVPHPPNTARFKKRSVKKTILVANLHARDPSKPSSSRAGQLMHTVITQVIVTLDGITNHYNVSTVAEEVKKQIGFEVVLLDSKLFPIADNDSTSGPKFWRSTRKVIAAKRIIYEKLVGRSVGEELSQLEDDDISTGPPNKKVKNRKFEDIGAKVDGIDKKLDKIDKKLSIFDETFECIICRSVVKCPIVSHCCKRIVGCKRCISTWRTTNTRCPLCSETGQATDSLVELKGFDDLTALFQESVLDQPIVQSIEISEGSSDDFEDLPTFSSPHT